MSFPLQESFEANHYPILKMLRAYIVLAVLTLLAFVPFASAQYRASIQGVVTDTQGGVIPGATLTLVNNSTNEKQVRTSDGTGVFNFNALPADRFTLTVTMNGFQTKVLNNVQIIPEQANALNIQLDVASVAQTVTVDASQSPLIDTESATLGRTISDNEVQHMPVYERDATQPPSIGARSTGGWRSGSWRRRIPGAGNAVRRIVRRGRQSRTLQQHLRHGKWHFCKREWRPVRHEWIHGRWHQHGERRLGWCNGHYAEPGFNREYPDSHQRL